MPKKASEEYTAFEQLTDKLLSVPKSTLDARVKAHRERPMDANSKTGPKPKVKPSASVRV